MTSFKEYIAHHGSVPRPSRKTRRHVREDVGDVSVARSSGLDTASVALPAGIDLDDRAGRMNDLWRALVAFQSRNVLVVALCVDKK